LLKITILRYTLLFSLFLIAFVDPLLGQTSYSLSGKITDASTGLALVGASIGDTENNLGTSSDKSGNYKLYLTKGKHIVIVSFIGYEKLTTTINLNENTLLNLQLTPTNVELDDIEVEAKQADQNITNTQAGVVQIEGKAIEKLPSFLGEPDIISTLKLTPGIQAGGEGNAGLYVRGGDGGQNLIVYEDIPIYNPTHLLGVYSVFNPESIEKVTISKGYKPTYYNDIASSVIEVNMREGDKERFKTHLSFGFLTNSATIEAPLKNARGSFILSGRYASLLIVKNVSTLLNDKAQSFYTQTNYNFNDLTFKLNYNLSTKDRLYLMAYQGCDNYSYQEEDLDFDNNMRWGNMGAAIRYNHEFNHQLFSDLILGTTKYKFELDATISDYNCFLKSKINDLFGQLNLTYHQSSLHKIKGGFQFTHHQLAPTSITLNVLDIDYQSDNKLYSNEYSAFINSLFRISPRLNIEGGLRSTVFDHVGPYTQYTEDKYSQIVDSINYKSNELVKRYNALSGGITTVFLINQSSSLKAAFQLSHQFIHLASVGSVSLPTDVWIPCTDYLKPQKVTMGSLGYFKNFYNHTLETSVEIYYKKMDNQVDFLNGITNNVDNTKIKSNLIIGEGRAYGAEFFIKRNSKRLTGWLSYTLSRTLRRFDEINNGEFYPAKYDRIHDLSLTLNYQINAKLDVSAAFIYSTGNAMTLPVGRYIIQQEVANQYSDVNAYRMPNYHRLDLSANYQLKKTNRYESVLNLSIFNVYNRANTYFIYFKAEVNYETYYLRVQPKQISLFPILPSLSWKLTF